ncbi:MAG: hypothetical protein V3T21_03825 [Candidatus Margulisiibacteriota bacterium]
MAGPIRLLSSYFPRMKTALAKIERDQSHMNVYPKFYNLLNKLGVARTLSKNDIAKGFFGRHAEVGNTKEITELNHWYRAEAAIDLVGEIIEILEIKELLSKNDLEILALVSSVFDRLSTVKNPLMENISDRDLEEIGNLIIIGTVSSEMVESSTRVDADRIRNLSARARKFSRDLPTTIMVEELLIDEEATVKASIISNRITSALARPMPREAVIMSLLRQLEGEYKYLLNHIISQLPREHKTLRELADILQDLTGLLD